MSLLITLILAAMPFLLNMVMGLVKMLVAQDWSAPWKRAILAILALVGTICFNLLNGTPIDPNSVQSLLQMIAEAFIAFLSSHATFSLFWQKQ